MSERDVAALIASILICRFEPAARWHGVEIGEPDDVQRPYTDTIPDEPPSSCGLDGVVDMGRDRMEECQRIANIEMPAVRAKRYSIALRHAVFLLRRRPIRHIAPWRHHIDNRGLAPPIVHDRLKAFHGAKV